MTDSAVTSALSFYSRHGAALFPIPYGQKSPGSSAFWPVTDAASGEVRAGSFAHDCSADPAQWDAWQAANPGCNFGVVAGPSGWIVVDIDTKDDRNAAWALWCELCASWGLDAVPLPHVQSARGGWHVLFKVPAGTNPAALRQPDAIKGKINIRAGNGFVVAAGSVYVENGAALPYTLITDVPPYPAPAALVEHCTRRERAPASSGTKIGTRDMNDVAGLVRWLAERGEFSAYEDWVALGMALRLEYGNDGFSLWELAFDDGPNTPQLAASKWQSFSDEPDSASVTLNSFMKRAHEHGWRGTIGKSTSAMFADAIAQLAANSGATLTSGGPGAVPDGMPMLAGQEALCRLGLPVLDEFLSGTIDAPARPLATDYPQLPPEMSGHGLYAKMQDTIARVVAMMESPSTWKGSRVKHAMAVLMNVHRDVAEAIGRRATAAGCTWPGREIRLEAAAVGEAVEREFVGNDQWHYDLKGSIEHNNSDNVRVFLGIIGCEVRWNGWLERAEICGAEWREWTYLDDTVVAKLRTRGNRTKTRFVPGKDFLWETLVAIAHENPVDPALDRLADLQAAWDGRPRLALWLALVCNLVPDAYHQAVGRNIIGGMVRRIRQPGCKHDTMPVFYGFQGSGKSTLARIIGDMGQTPLPVILSGAGASWFTDAVQLGDESKELVLSLAGRCMVEVAEMSNRTAADARAIKAMVSRQEDSGRTAYARAVTERKRRNVFFGTTNEDEPLTDPTGNRRFLPVRVNSELHLDWLSNNIGQLIGEAAHYESQGDDFAIPRDVWGIAAEHQEAARSESDIETLFGSWFAEGPYSTHAYITAKDLVDLCGFASWRGSNQSRSGLMKRLGFRRSRESFSGKQEWVWLRGAALAGAVRFVIGKDSSNGVPTVTIRAA